MVVPYCDLRKPAFYNGLIKYCKQTLSIEKGLTKPQKQNVIDVLLQGDVEFPKHPQKQTEDSYDLMRKFAIILLNDIMANRESRVRKEFQKVMKPRDKDLIKDKFSNRQQHINDMYAENRNDDCKYATLATQADFDRF